MFEDWYPDFKIKTSNKQIIYQSFYSNICKKYKIIQEGKTMEYLSLIMVYIRLMNIRQTTSLTNSK